MSKWLPLANVRWPLLVMVLVAMGSLFAFFYGARHNNHSLFLGSSMTGVVAIAAIADYMETVRENRNAKVWPNSQY